MTTTTTPTAASVSATTDCWTVDDAGIDTFELEASRRALANLRTLLYGKPMWDLIEAQVDASEKQFQEWYAASNGEYRGGQVKLAIDGVSVKQLFGSIMQTLGAAFEPDAAAKKQAVIDGVFPAHPEHYGLALEGPGGVETMGGLPTLTFPSYVETDDVPDFIRDLIDPSYELSKVGTGLLRDGTVQSYVLQEFRDVEGGIEASLRIWYPAACPESVVEEHLRHYTVEFRNGVRAAAGAQA